jgi:hypothetical protein
MERKDEEKTANGCLTILSSQACTGECYNDPSRVPQALAAAFALRRGACRRGVSLTPSIICWAGTR